MPTPLMPCSEGSVPDSLVISSQVAEPGGMGEADPVLEDNPVIITFSFEVVCTLKYTVKILGQFCNSLSCIFYSV